MIRRTFLGLLAGALAGLWPRQEQVAVNAQWVPVVHRQGEKGKVFWYYNRSQKGAESVCLAMNRKLYPGREAYLMPISSGWERFYKSMPPDQKDWVLMEMPS